jgi:iron complex transport system substrate-binding protein
MKLSTVIVGFRTLISLLLLFAISGALSAQEAPAPDCVAEYDPAVNYFPETMQVEYAEGFTIDYANHYKIVTVTRPWPGAETGFTYVLVQCGTPAPDDIPDDAVVIEVPVTSAASLSATYAPHFAELDLLDTLIAVDNADNLYNPAIRERIEAGQIAEIGGGSTVNVELALDLAPQVIFTYGSGFPEYDAHPVLAEAGLTPVINGDFNETTPLGRAEWIKFTAAFFNKEAKAQEEYAAMKQRYQAVAEKAKAAANKPTVISGMANKDKWFVPGGSSYMARLILDAGGAYLYADDTSAGSLPLAFEEVYDKAVKADVWLLNSFQRYDSIKAVLEAEPRYAEMAAVKRSNVWNNDKRVNENGGNDYWETGVGNPDLLLADLVKILHPELLPDHELTFWRQIPAEPAQ